MLASFVLTADGRRPFPSPFFFNDTATTEIYTLSLHDALPISREGKAGLVRDDVPESASSGADSGTSDRKSTRLNSSHQIISYAVFCLKKKKTHIRRLVNVYIERQATHPPPTPRTITPSARHSS